MFYAVLAFAITALDQWTKKAVREHVKPGEIKKTGTGNAYITNLENTGAAYGLFSDKPQLLLLLTAISTTLITRSYMRIFSSEKNNPAYKLSFAMLMGGAAGNIIDRIRRGSVTDFMCIPFSKKAPVFNVADLFVALGVFVFMLAGFRKQKIISTCKSQGHRV